jgi:hypothetical protein
MDPVAAAGVEKLVVVKKTPSLYFLLEYTPYLNIDSFAHFEGDTYNLLTAAFALLLSIEISMTLYRC